MLFVVLSVFDFSRNKQTGTLTRYETCTLRISHDYWPNKKNCRLIELENH